LGNLHAVNSLYDLVWVHKLDAIFLFETLVHAKRVGEIKIKLNFDYYFFIDSCGRSGGLAFFRRKPFNCRLINLFGVSWVSMVSHKGLKGGIPRIFFEPLRKIPISHGA